MSCSPTFYFVQPLHFACFSIFHCPVPRFHLSTNRSYCLDFQLRFHMHFHPIPLTPSPNAISIPIAVSISISIFSPVFTCPTLSYASLHLQYLCEVICLIIPKPASARLFVWCHANVFVCDDRRGTEIPVGDTPLPPLRDERTDQRVVLNGVVVWVAFLDGGTEVDEEKHGKPGAHREKMLSGNDKGKGHPCQIGGEHPRPCANRSNDLQTSFLIVPTPTPTPIAILKTLFPDTKPVSIPSP